MLTHAFWLSSLLLIASATAHVHVHAPGGLKPRYLSTGTGLSAPSTGTPPYPTGSTIGTIVPTASSYSSNPTSTAAPPAVPTTPSLFYLVTAGTGTFLDGYHLHHDCCYGGGSHGTLAILRFTKDAFTIAETISTFSLNVNGTLKNTYGSVGRVEDDSFGDNSYWFFNNGDIYGVNDDTPVSESICEIAGDGGLTCIAGVKTIFYVCGTYSEDEVANFVALLGTEVPEGCFQFFLEVVPA